MTTPYHVKCMADGNPSVFVIGPNTNLHFFVDMTGEGNITFANYSVSLPVENARDYECYPNLPREELDAYFNKLMKKVMAALTEEDRQTLDICAIQHDLLENCWSSWIRMGILY